MNDFLSAIQERRSCYTIKDSSPIPDTELLQQIREAARHSPSSFHTQSARLLVLFGTEHVHLWEMVLDTLRGHVPQEQFGATQKKIAGFAAGHGTILYFDNQTIVSDIAKKYPLYRENFPVWAQQANGMLQFTIWTLLRQAGLGASLQHYNPLIDEAVCAAWDIPADWKLIAQMPFGEPTAPPAPKKLRDGADLVLAKGLHDNQ